MIKVLFSKYDLNIIYIYINSTIFGSFRFLDSAYLLFVRMSYIKRTNDNLKTQIDFRTSDVDYTYYLCINMYILDTRIKRSVKMSLLSPLWPLSTGKTARNKCWWYIIRLEVVCLMHTKACVQYVTWWCSGEEYRAKNGFIRFSQRVFF